MNTNNTNTENTTSPHYRPFQRQRDARQDERNAAMIHEITLEAIGARHHSEPRTLAGALRAALSDAGHVEEVAGHFGYGQDLQ